MATQIALIEDKPVDVRALTEALKDETALHLLSVYPTGEDALRQMPLAKVDLAIVDIVLPRMSGIELVRQLKEQKPKLLVLMLTAFGDAGKIFASLAAGADGYVLKSASPQEWRTAIKQVMNGGAPITPSVARKIIQYFRGPETRSPEFAKLTDREMAVLREVATGRTYKEVGAILGITAETVRVHIRNIRGKLHASSRVELIAKFLKS